MSKLTEILKCFLGLQSPDTRGETPRDLKEFNLAKKRLKTNAKAFSREIDQFGHMVYGMRDIALPAPKKKATKKKRATRKKQ